MFWCDKGQFFSMYWVIHVFNISVFFGHWISCFFIYIQKRILISSIKDIICTEHYSHFCTQCKVSSVKFKLLFRYKYTWTISNHFIKVLRWERKTLLLFWKKIQISCYFFSSRRQLLSLISRSFVHQLFWNFQDW